MKFIEKSIFRRRKKFNENEVYFKFFFSLFLIAMGGIMLYTLIVTLF